MVSTSRASHWTVLALCVARGITCTSPRYDERPPARATDLDTIADDVFGAMCTILAPESWCWFSPAKANDSVSPLACSPISQMAGYFMVTLRSEEHTSELQSRGHRVCRPPPGSCQ